MYQTLVLECVPTEAVPGFSPPTAFVCCPESLANISLTNVNGCRTVVEDVNALSAFATSRDVLDVLGVSHTHFAELVNQCHHTNDTHSPWTHKR